MSEILSILKWHQEMGIEHLCDELPFNAYKEHEIKKNKKSAKTNDNINNNKLLEDNLFINDNLKKVASKTKMLADNCNNLEELKNIICNFKDLSICKTATNTVFGDGNPKSDIMFIGEAPGAEEDIAAIPFCGQSGQLLTKIFSYVGLHRDKNYYITNSVFWRPPGNRKPTSEEIAICKPLLEKYIALINPKIIILVGATSITAVTNNKTPITKLRGKFFNYTNNYLNNDIKAMGVLHPSYLLRSPGQKRFAWQDALTLKSYINENNIKI